MKNFLFILLLAISLPGSGQYSSQYKIINQIHLPGDGFWDYISVDTKGHLYVSHSTMIQVVDSKNGTLLGTIDNLSGVHGIALAENLNKGFISSGRDSVVAIIDLNTLKIIEKVKVTGANPDAILYDPFSNNVFVFNGRSTNATVINALTNKVVATINLEGKPEFSVTDKKGKIYVNIEDKSLISCINSKELKVEKSWSISPGEEPSGLAADFENNRLFSVCGNKKMIVFDLKTGKVAAALPIGSGTDGAAFDEGLKRAYSSNGEGTITVVQETGDNFKVLNSVPSRAGARTMCVDQRTHHLYLPTAEFEPLAAGERRPKMKPGTFMVLDVAPVR
ncbi:MAG TPA: YncE family protein [Bacteroidales bacterium]|nr:YncE family protein [Bacteroidales bacterium]